MMIEIRDSDTIGSEALGCVELPLETSNEETWYRLNSGSEILISIAVENPDLSSKEEADVGAVNNDEEIGSRF